MDISFPHCGPLDEMFYYAALDYDEILDLDDVDEHKKPYLGSFPLSLLQISTLLPLSYLFS